MAGILRLLLTGAVALAALVALPAATAIAPHLIAARPQAASGLASAAQHAQHLPLLLRSAGPAFPPHFRISIDATAHANYGLAYPVTYRFALPPGAANLDAEVGGCSQDIKDNLAVPYPSGAAEYVVAYVDPGGYSDATLRATLARYHYLVERSIYQNVEDFAPWSEDDGLYERVGVTLCGDDRSLLELDMAFYWARQRRGIYHLYIHPWLHDWSDGSPIRQHIDHIKGWSDLWYVGFGHLYLYRYVQERGLVAVSALAGM